MLSNLSDTASVWVYQSDRQLNNNEIELINQRLDVFIPEWSAHGSNLKSEYQVVDNFFIVVGVDESVASAGGCSKDSLTRAIKSIGEKINVDFFNRLNTAFINETGEIAIVNMVELKTLMEKNIVGNNTIVFNNLVENISQLKSNWKVALKDSWHINLVPIQ